MALKLSKEINVSGITAEYWRIRNMVYHADNKRLFCVLGVYKDSDARTAGKQPIEEKRYFFEDVEVSAMEDNDNIVKHGYILLKAHSDFDGAEDI